MPSGVGPSFHSMNGIPVSQLDLSLPRNGAWIADVVVSNPTNPLQGVVPTGKVPAVGDPCVLVVDSFTFVGSAIAVSTALVGEVHVRVIGGLTGGLSTTCPPLNLALGPTLQVAASAVLGLVQETLNPALSNPALMSALLPGFQVLSDRTASQNLSRMAQSAGGVWRVDPTTGTVAFVIDTFLVPAQLPTNAQATDAMAGVGTSYDCPILDALPLPGQLAPDGSPINEVKVVTSENALHVQLFSSQLSSLFTPPMGVDTARMYPGTVTLQNPDGTVAVAPDNTSVAPIMARVRVRSCAPSVTLKVLPGARVVVGFDNGDPSQLPFVVAFMGFEAGDFLMPLGMTIGNPLLAQPLAKFIALNTALTTLMGGITAYATAIKSIADPSGTATTALGTAFASVVTELGLVPSSRLQTD